MKNSNSFRRGALGLAIAGLAASAFISGGSSAYHDPDKKPGKDIKEDRALDTFTKIRVKGAIELHLVAGKDQKVTIETAENRMADVETFVRGDTLVIDMDTDGHDNYWHNVDVEVMISMQMLEGIEVMGAVEADVTGVDSDELEIDIKGAADLDIEGKCGSLDLDVKGAADISARDLKCENVSVDVKGAGSADIFATNKVNADVAGVASIDIYGKPKNVRQHAGFMASINVH